MPHRTQQQVIKRRLRDKEGSARVKELRAILAELPGYKNGPYADLRKWVEAQLEETRTRNKVVHRDSIAVKRQGAAQVVVVGAPNAGKSSLLNALAGSERAIVTEHAGTTRDLLRETLDLEGLQLTLVDTAGLRAAPDAIEAEGIRRARAELERADLALAVLDATDPGAAAALAADVAGVPNVLWLHNKADLVATAARHAGPGGDGDHLWLSARTGAGLDPLRARLHALAAGDTAAGSFSARQRHLDALARSGAALAAAAARLVEHAAELAAEDLRGAQAALGEITGTFDAEALLGRIFAGFCIGK
jgi:tRNA modification GTPase